jgi:hypothetical protein
MDTESIQVLTAAQDLKQQKFVIEAEPTELVRSPVHVVTSASAMASR